MAIRESRRLVDAELGAQLTLFEPSDGKQSEQFEKDREHPPRPIGWSEGMMPCKAASPRQEGADRGVIPATSGAVRLITLVPVPQSAESALRSITRGD